ncbi:MAG: polysaccharide biosynthesis protein, partial [Pseudomonadota bacterium]
TALYIATAVFAGSASIATGLSRSFWRYTSVPDVVAILRVAGLTFGALAGLRLLLGPVVPPDVATLAVGCVVYLAILCGARVAYRLSFQSGTFRWRRPANAVQPAFVAIIGADSDTDLLIRAINDQQDGRYRAVALLDVRDRRTGRNIRGVPIVSSLSELDAIVARLARTDTPLQHLIFDEERMTLDEAQIDKLIEWGAQHRITLLRATKLDAVLGHGYGELNTKPVRIDDLLGRPVTSLETTNLTNELEGRTVLVTGGGGSIGSELCCSIAALRPRRLIVLDLSESNLEHVRERLGGSITSETELVTRVGDVRDRTQVFEIFDAEQPDFVFHAAALKHVPIVEVQPLAGMMTNVIGTANVADAARSFKARAMVMISTDKAVNPRSVMGATKRLAEHYCQALDVQSSTRFVTVRFGNVLGSSGSVVPLFEQQILAGGPVTVTHAEMSRYFMTISEASQLVLHAMDVALEAESQRGCIHVLDMGEPVQIIELARKMILLSGHRPNVDIDIKVIGLRPGEKLFEELFGSGENQVETNRRGVLVGAPLKTRSKVVVSRVNALREAIIAGAAQDALEVLSAAVPEASLSPANLNLPVAADAKGETAVIELAAHRRVAGPRTPSGSGDTA